MKLISLTFIVVAVIIIKFFAPSYVRYLFAPYYSIDLTATFTLFYLSMLIIIAVKDKSILLGFSGFCFGMIGNFIMTEYYLNSSSNNNVLLYGEIMWLLNVLLISMSLVSIIKLKLYDPEKWFFNSKSVRNKQAFVIFHISLLGYILACIVIKEFNIISEVNFVFLPSFGMLYAMISAILSVILGNQSKKPFNLLKKEIKSLFDGNQSIINGFNTIEFEELNRFITDCYNYKVSLEKYIVSAATRVAHDIKSPIQIIENLVKNHAADTDIFKKQLSKQVNKIGYISKSLLKENKKVIESNYYGYQSLYSIISDLIQDKYIEWNLEDNVIEFIYKSDQIIWLDSVQSGIKVVLSNLLNNSHEASKDDDLRIIVTVELVDSNINITIKDFGCGIKEESLENILNGKSFKASGNGVGLSSAKKFMASIGGSLEIDPKVSRGTEVRLKFCMGSIPKQFARNISIKTNSIIIVDDSTHIIYFWQKFFTFMDQNPNIKHKFFANYSSYVGYAESNNQKDTTYLLDYSIFGETLTGVDIVKKYNLENVFLVTDYAEDIKLQDEINGMSLQLVPKSMLNILQQNKGITL